MSIRIYSATALMLSLVACSATSSPEVVVQNTDQASLKVSPAGVATIVFTDLETIRPDNLAAGASGSSCISVFPLSATSFKYTFNGCRSANGGTMTGTVTVTISGTGTVVNTAVYDVTVLETVGSWHYTGTKVTTTNATAKTATISVPAGQPFLVAYSNPANTTKNKTWAYVPNLQADWSSATATKFWGSYTFQQTLPLPVGDTLTASIPQATPLTWTSGCAFPIAGVLTLSLPPASAEIRFDTSITEPNVQKGCGIATINGYKLTLGQ
jgi:hypothetical protein